MNEQSNNPEIKNININMLPSDYHASIRGVRLRNFRVFEDTQFSFEPLTTFIGINGSGKSSLIRGLVLLPWVETYGGLRSIISRIGGSTPFFRHGASSFIIEIGYDLTHKSDRGLSGSLDHSLTLKRSKKSADGYRVWKEKVDVYDHNNDVIAHAESVNRRKAAVKSSPPIEWLSMNGFIKDDDGNTEEITADSMRIPIYELPSLSWINLRFLPQFTTVYDPIASSIRVDPSSTTLFRSDGQGSGWLEMESTAMWNFLYSMCQSGNISEASKRRKERWLANVREFLPWISNVTAERDLSGNIRLIIHELDGGKFHPIHVSDGTLMLLGHLAILESGGSIIIVDEPETHLHPDAIHTLMKIYRRYLENPKTSVKQVIITTQSPFVVRNCKPEEIRVVQRRGATSEVLHVADNPLDLQKQLDNAGLSLDEAWLSNIFGGTTA